MRLRFCKFGRDGPVLQIIGCNRTSASQPATSAGVSQLGPRSHGTSKFGLVGGIACYGKGCCKIPQTRATSISPKHENTMTRWLCNNRTWILNMSDGRLVRLLRKQFGHCGDRWTQPVSECNSAPGQFLKQPAFYGSHGSLTLPPILCHSLWHIGSRIVTNPVQFGVRRHAKASWGFHGSLMLPPVRVMNCRMHRGR